MSKVKSVKFDGEAIHVFNSAIYLFVTAGEGYFLQLDMIVSEIVLRKYQNETNLIVEIELEDGRVFGELMELKALPGGLPQLNLICEVEDNDEYKGFTRINELEGMTLPDIEEGLTIEEIRAVEMPNERINLKLNLPIDQVEWLRNQKTRDLNKLFKQLINEYIGK